MTSNFKYLLSLIALTFTLAACSSGGGGGGTTSPPPPPASGWEPGVFDPWINFFSRCENPRSGVDPSGLPWPDVQGTLLDENNFLRSYSDDTYLWYDEITDRDPGLFNDPEDYFDLLKTFANIPGTNQPKDPPGFHFSMDTDDYFQQFVAGEEFGYGAEIAVLSGTPPREVVVVFTEPGSSADQAGVTRGARVVGIDGFDIDDNTQAGVNALNAAIFPSTDGEMHTFRILDLGSQTPRDVVLTATIVEKAFVQNVTVLDTPTGRIGYLTFNQFFAKAEEQLVDAFNQLNAGQGVDDLVLDLRYNGGGINDIAGQLGYMIAGPTRTAGRTFDLVTFNDKHPTIDPVTGQAITPTPFFSTTQGFDPGFPAGNPLPTLDLPRVYILTGSGTCSASESVINGLRGIDVEVILIGDTTCGKPYGFYPTPNCGVHYFTIQLKGTNDKGYGDFVFGFQPSAVDNGEDQVLGCVVADDFNSLLGDPGEDRLEVALAFRDGMGCIAPTAGASGGQAKASVETTLDLVYQTPLKTSRIHRP